MKKLVIVTVITACLILCAAMWPHNIPTKEAAATPLLPTETATQLADPSTMEIEKLIPPEEEKTEIGNCRKMCTGSV